MKRQHLNRVDDEIAPTGIDSAEIELVDLGRAEEKTKQAPGFVVWDNPFVSGPWHKDG